MKKVKADEYISIIGHELRTPLSTIRGYLSMIIEGDMGEITDEMRKALNHCYDSSVRLIKLTNDILALSKIEAGKMEYYMKEIGIVDLMKCVNNDIFLEAKAKQVEFKIEIDKNLKDKMISTDKDKLEQVFINLITNAIKFTDVGGKVILKASKVKNKVKFEIIDNGIGIPKEKLKNIFDKFMQIEFSLQRQNTSGLGIGLALCKNYLEDFGSEIKVKSELGKGSNFYFELKLV